jgi:hypothetical protein
LGREQLDSSSGLSEVWTDASGNIAWISSTAELIIGLTSLSVSLWSVRGAQEIKAGAKTNAQSAATRPLFMCPFRWLYGLDCFDRSEGSVAILAFYGGFILEIALARHRALEAVTVIVTKDDAFLDKRSGRLSDPCLEPYRQ